jgi:hypothetical protein
MQRGDLPLRKRVLFIGTQFSVQDQDVSLSLVFNPSTCPSCTTSSDQVPTCIRVVCYHIPRTSMSLCVFLHCVRQIVVGKNTLTIRTFLFSPPLSAQAPACTANFCVFCFYRPTGRPRSTSLPLECHRNTTNWLCSVSNALHFTSC